MINDSARSIRLTALSQAHLLLATLYSELLLEESDRGQFEITKHMLEVRALISALGGLRHE